MDAFDESLFATNIVGFVVFGVGEDHEDAIGGEVVHLAPKARADKEPLGGRIKHDAFLAAAVEKADSHRSSDAYTELVELLVCVEAATDTGLGPMNPVDATDYEG
jgi:hypothetical protein